MEGGRLRVQGLPCAVAFGTEALSRPSWGTDPGLGVGVLAARPCRADGLASGGGRRAPSSRDWPPSFCQRPDNKYLRLCEPYSLCFNYSVPLRWCGRSHRSAERTEPGRVPIKLYLQRSHLRSVPGLRAARSGRALLENTEGGQSAFKVETTAQTLNGPLVLSTSQL